MFYCYESDLCGRHRMSLGFNQPVTCIIVGVVYQPWEPVFLVSLGNSFLFRCADGVHIDGKDTGLSKMMYK